MSETPRRPAEPLREHGLLDSRELEALERRLGLSGRRRQRPARSLSRVLPLSRQNEQEDVDHE